MRWLPSCDARRTLEARLTWLSTRVSGEGRRDLPLPLARFLGPVDGSGSVEVLGDVFVDGNVASADLGDGSGSVTVGAFLQFDRVSLLRGASGLDGSLPLAG